jgi:hypothetical protein
LKNKSKFDSLKRLLLIILTGLFFLTASFGQDGRTVPGNDPGKGMKLYPNPASSFITFDLTKGHQRGLNIVVYNFLGKKMSENQNVGEKTTLQLGDYNRGVYIFHVTDQSGKVLDTGKFQVAR